MDAPSRPRRAMSGVRQLYEPMPAAAATEPRRRDRTRAALIRAGEQLMAERPVDAVSIDDIVAAAGVAKGTFYNHFEDKETLQREVLEQIRIEVRAAIAALNGSIADPARRVARAFCAVVRYGLEHPRRGNFLSRTSMTFRLIEDRMNEGLIQDVGIGLAEGRFVISSTESGALLMLCITQATLVRTLEEPAPFSVAARTQQMAVMLLRGLGVAQGEADMIAAQETDQVICGHAFKAGGGVSG